MARSQVLEIVAVYDSDTTWMTRLYAMLGRQTFDHPCALSQLTTHHGHARQDWIVYVDQSQVPIRCYTKNMMDVNLYYVVRSQTPCVVARCTHHQNIMLLDPSALRQCAGDIQQFKFALYAAIDHRFLCL